MRSQVYLLLLIRDPRILTALHGICSAARHGTARRSNFYARSVPGMLLFLMEQKIQYGRARICSYVGRFAGVHCSALRQTLR